MIIGVDPGLSGALVALEDDGTYFDHLDMPSIIVQSKGRVNAAAIQAWIVKVRAAGATDLRHCYIELVGAMPKQGGSSQFSFGHNTGMVEGVVIGAGVPITRIHPATWKKAAKMTGKPKDAVRSRCVDLYPGVRVLDSKGKGGAVADAMLIARVGAGLEC